MSKPPRRYIPYFRWGTPLRVGFVELHEIGYDPKTKEVVIKLFGDGVFKVEHIIELPLPKQPRGGDK